LKAQASIEFMFMVASATFMILIFVVVYSVIYQDNISDKKQILAQDLGFSIQNEFIMAVQVRDGYRRTFLVPDTLEGIKYNISIIGNALMLANITPIPIPAVVGEIRKGKNTIVKENNTLCLNC